MKKEIKIAIGFIVVAVLAVSAASIYWMQSGAFNVNPQPSATPNATPTPQAQTPAPSAEPAITISYHSADLGCGRQCADINVTNQGYTSFSTNPEKFFITVNGANYTYSTAFTPQFGNWQNTVVANGATYSGTLVFNNPSTTNPFVIGYNDSTYNIVYIQK